MNTSAGFIQVHRPLDLGRIDAIGFDLDHTLALYDDAAVNEIAAASARRFLVEEKRYPEALLEAAPPMESPAAGRTLAADLAHGAVVKLGAGRRALHGRLGGRWMSTDDVRTRFADAIADEPAAAYSVYSPFELPVLWLLEAMEAIQPARGDRAARCEDIRRMLDAAHTNGTLKQHLRDDLARFVGAIGGVAEGLARWKSAGKVLFLVTNSERDFAPAVLDIAVGRAWRSLFDAVVVSASKPAFFRGGIAAAAGGARAPRDGNVIEGGCAHDLEKLLGVPRDRILFVGDNTRSDVRAAADHGWRTAQVAPELTVECPASGDGWGAPLVHDGDATWLAERMRAADLAFAHAGVLLALDPNAHLSVPECCGDSA